MRYTLKRTVKSYERCTVEAESFSHALSLWLNNPQQFDGSWEDAQLGEDEYLDGIEDETGNEVDIDDDGTVIE